ncbi:hypothetical protein RJ639_046013 [Escallonia herrerae]|uniref:TAF1C beta-propeller domain-containing protein n=1 Tax=Escallonia herrerae TaxID=1293975 RepID=A0AA89AXE0_9ASTE|nr:hypothetical protein RJ639_046013 [Escallonia herrerae]
MEFSEEWKSLWPISYVFDAPFLLSRSCGGGSADGDKSSCKETGPLLFNPLPKSLTKLLHSPNSLSSAHFVSTPSLSLLNFLQTSADSPILPSTASSIVDSFFGDQDADTPPLLTNCLQLLRCPDTNMVFAFFPTGPNSDKVGFVMLSVKDSRLDVEVPGGGRGDVLTTKTSLNHRIVQLLVNPVGDPPFPCSVSSSSTTLVGYLLACTMYSICCYGVSIKGVGSGSKNPASLDFLGSKLFKTCIVHTCWSPHLPEESLVLLQSGELFLFDLDSCSGTGSKFSGKKLKVLWNDSTILQGGEWLSCEFSWHPRILIVAHSNAVFLVDLRSERSRVCCLLKMDFLTSFNVRESDHFVAFSRAGSDGFYFTVASNDLLLLCDVRNPLVPLLQWQHGLENPHYVTVFRLSELRSHSRDDKFKWASDMGYCILLGSFSNCEFSLFCYGPDNRGSAASEILKFSKSLYAWELPSDISLSGRGCQCADCIVREEFSKDALPRWQQKKELVFGFGILDTDLSVQLCEPDAFGGFTVIRLMSSGVLESQRYLASFECVNYCEEAHKERSLCYESSQLCAMDDGEYKFPKKYHYLKLDCLNAYLKDSLAKALHGTERKIFEDPQKNHTFTLDFHHNCQEVKASVTSHSVDDVFKDIRSPTSIREIASSRIWATLPTNLLCLAFSTYSEFLEVLGNYRSVSSGPGVPLQFLVTLRILGMGKANVLSADQELELECNKVMQVANVVTMSGSASDLQIDHAVSFPDDGKEIDSQKAKFFSMHEPVAFSNKFCTGDPKPTESMSENARFKAFVYRTRQKEPVSIATTDRVGAELFDTQCPAELEFDACDMNSKTNKVQNYKLLERQYAKFKESFNLYQEVL